MNFKELERYLNACIMRKKIPGAEVWVGNKKRVFYFESFGYAQIIPEKIKMQKDTIFDLASITKPLCTAMAMMYLVDKKEIKLEDPVEKYVEEFKGKPNGKKTIKDLLTHTSGLPAWFPLYILPEDKRIEYLANTNTGRDEVIYSCLGYIILFLIVERITGQRFDRLCQEEIFKKLGLKYLMFNPSKKIKNIAATEMGNEHEKKMAAKYGNVERFKWRNYLIKGEVHDGNCFYGFKGVSGNAGLFSNAQELVKILRAYLNGEIIKIDGVKQMIKDWTCGPEKRGLGWWINPYPEFLSDKAFGHTGFTGTMVMIEPKKNLIIILLANCVHPKVRLGIMPEIRKKVIQIITDSLKKDSKA